MSRSNNLQDLIRRSSSTRQYFLSLPVEMQMKLHARNDHIRTAQELRLNVSFLEKTSLLD